MLKIENIVHVSSAEATLTVNGVGLNIRKPGGEVRLTSDGSPVPLTGSERLIQVGDNSPDDTDPVAVKALRTLIWPKGVHTL